VAIRSGSGTDGSFRKSPNESLISSATLCQPISARAHYAGVQNTRDEMRKIYFKRCWPIAPNAPKNHQGPQECHRRILG
jgi:hypothetical protein